MTTTGGVNMYAIQMQMAESKLEEAASKNKDGAEQLINMKERRVVLKEKMKEQKAESEKIAGQLEEMAKRDWFEHALSDINPFDTNDDDLNADAKRLAAELEQKQHELDGLMERQKQELESIQNAQSSVKQTVDALEEISRDLREPVQSLA